MPLPIVLVVFGIGLTALELFVIACVLLMLFYALVEYYKAHPLTLPSFPSYGRTWDDYPATIPPIPAPPQTIPAPSPAVPVPPISVPIDEPIAIPKPRTRNRDKEIWNVYDLHFIQSVKARFYNFGQGYESVLRQYNIGDIYKYGVTSFNKTYLRYLIIQERFPTNKGDYVLELIVKLVLEPFEWYLYHVTYVEANAEEVRLIDAYVATHGEFPPGNTFRG